MNERGASQTAIKAVMPEKLHKKREFVSKLKYRFFLNYWFIRLRPIFLIRNKLKRTMLIDLRVIAEEHQKLKKNNKLSTNQDILVPKQIKELALGNPNKAKRSVSQIRNKRSMLYKKDFKRSLLNNTTQNKPKNKQSLPINNYSQLIGIKNDDAQDVSRNRDKTAIEDKSSLRSKSLILAPHREQRTPCDHQNTLA